MSLEIMEEAAREVLETTAGLSVLSARRPRGPEERFDGLVATISLVGTRGGTLVLYCHRPLASGMAAAMLGLDGREPDEETVRDALGELVNQIGGTIKRKLGVSGQEMALSVPVVVAGAPLSHCVKSEVRPVCVELETGRGPLCVCLWTT
ncbi:MAG TPA: chemotaxis protein CheX [Candidatus Binatia bacterium]|nr:chemotaxis protein CheX [Candidatus Binatia bacterium]